MGSSWFEGLKLAEEYAIKYGVNKAEKYLAQLMYCEDFDAFDCGIRDYFSYHNIRLSTLIAEKAK